MTRVGTAFGIKYKQDTINWSNEKIVEYNNLWIWLNEIMRVFQTIQEIKLCPFLAIVRKSILLHESILD
jgi:hypothetical protein